MGLSELQSDVPDHDRSGYVVPWNVFGGHGDDEGHVIAGEFKFLNEHVAAQPRNTWYYQQVSKGKNIKILSLKISAYLSSQHSFIDKIL